EEVASTLIKTLRCEWIHGFIADFFNTIGQILPFELAAGTGTAPSPDLRIAIRTEGILQRHACGASKSAD
ncbi:hypothetical protein NKI39_20065, partial [Mesorhizobium sp. M0664]|uniref:hypothetical protein n=1 Tax=Mesorhizobium sp. M0664 TaxID=2956982 RepID=UPI0033378676